MSLQIARNARPGLAKHPLLVIVGPTASGKSKLALDMAERYNGEIIAADSRTVYKGMDIGTAKPTYADQKKVPHHLLDVITPDKFFTAANFQRLANAATKDIQSRGKLPILVGGSGLYVDGVIYNFEFQPPVSQAERDRLAAMTVEQLQDEIKTKDYPMPENALNPRYLMRTIERKGKVVEKGELRANTIVIGLAPDIKVLKGRITKRSNEMIEDGLVEETKQLVKQYGADAPGLLSTSYKAIIQYLNGELSLEEAKEQFVLNDLHFAKRQKSWFKRSSDIHWFDDSTSALAFAENWLIENNSTGKKTIGKSEP
jgi:tRNA dimethylallyltransferase